MEKKSKGGKGQPVKGKATTVPHKITEGTHPFFNKYHDGDYVVSHDTRSNVTVAEKKTKYTLINDKQHEVVVYKIDDGIIKSKSKDDKKCDYGIYTEGEILLLVELKGNDYKSAVLQILNTIKSLGLDGQKLTKKLYARIVVSNAHNVPNSKYLSPKRKELDIILRKNKGGYDDGEIRYEEKLSTL